MSDVNPMMAMLLEHNSFVGRSIEIEKTVMPLPGQLAFGPGDAALLAAANSPLESDFGVIKCIPAEYHAETFPDWEERLLNSYVLCEVFSRMDPDVSLGWISRLKVMPISPEQYEETKAWLNEGFPSDAPDWCVEIYQDFTDQMSAKAPEVVPKAATCPVCKKRNLELRVVRTITYSGRAGVFTHNRVDKYVTVQEVNENSEHTAKLICTDCGAEATLLDEEWALQGISN